MDTSVWFKNIDEAFKSLLLDIKIDDKSIFSFIRLPEKEFVVPQYPSVSLTHLYFNYDSSRTNPDDIIRLSTDPQTFSAVFEEPASPYKLIYQIDFWAGYYTEMNSMCEQWALISKDGFILDTVDEAGIERKSLVALKDLMQTKIYKSGGKRILQSFQTLSVDVEIDKGRTYKLPIVNEVNIRRNRL